MYLPILRPLWYQYPSWHRVWGGIKRKITSYPRRHGKDIEDLSMASVDAYRRKGTYYYVFPTRKWGERAVWDTMAEIGGVSKRIIDWIFPDEIATKFKSDLRVEMSNGSMFFMGGTDNLDFVGQGGQGYTMSEFSLHRQEVTSLLAPIIRQSNAYLRLNGTMRGKQNPLYEIMQNVQEDPEWFCTWLKPEDTKLYCWVSDEHNVNPDIFDLIGKINPATGKVYVNVQGSPYYNIQSDIDSGLCSYVYARQEYLNEAEGVAVGSYFKYEIDAARKRDRIGRFGGISKSVPVFTAWDLGGASQEADATGCLLFQQHSDFIWIVGYRHSKGKSIGEDITGVRRMIRHNTDIRFGGHFVPHDAKKTSKQTKQDLLEFSKTEYKFEMRRVRKTDRVRIDIEICRRRWVKVKVDLDGEGVQEWLDMVELYRENPVTMRPDHRNDDGSSHAGDAYRTMIMAQEQGLVQDYAQKKEQNAHEDWNIHEEGRHGGGFLIDSGGGFLH